MLVLVIDSLVKQVLHHLDATASSFVNKLWGKVLARFHADTIKHHTSMQK
jgi:hypothetical protein